MPVFDWLAKNPEEASLFSQTMVGVHGGEPLAVAAAYDFSGLNTIVDVGGAMGDLLTTMPNILQCAGFFTTCRTSFATRRR